MLRVLRPVYYFSVQSFNPAKNYYRILNVDESASQEAIKASFKALAKRYHPDFNKGKEEQFKEINEAYQVLSDKETKFQYDQARGKQHSHQQNYPQQQPHQYAGTQHPRTNNQQHFYYEYRGPNYQSGWARSDQQLHQFFRQQQEFFNKFHRAQRQNFQRRSRSPLEDEYMRRFMEEVMAREQAKRYAQQMREQMSQALRAEREAKRREKEQLQRQLAENTRKLKMMGKRVVEDVKDFAKAAWNIFKDLKGKK